MWHSFLGGSSHKPLAAAMVFLQLHAIHASPTPLQAREEDLRWAVVGDSWASGVQYNSSMQYDGKCMRSTDSWGAQMAQDSSWSKGKQDFSFTACGATKMDAVGAQLSESGQRSLVWGVFGGNNVEFGNIARACIYQPRPIFSWSGWGPPWDEDEKGEGLCKKHISNAEDYLNEQGPEGFKSQFSKTLDTALAVVEKSSTPSLDLYVSSYVQFFDDSTDECDQWSFAHDWISAGRPKLVKGLRRVINDNIRKINGIQADVIKDYKPQKPEFKVRNVQPDDLYKGHRFCEKGHSFEDQFYGDDVWIWNLQYYDTKEQAGKEETPKTENGVTYMSATEEEPPEKGGVLMGPMLNATENEEAGAQSGSGGGIGWASRPFHPKFNGHRSMKEKFIKTMMDDKIAGVKGSDDKGSSKDKKECFGLENKKYVSRDPLKDIIENQFCPDAEKEGRAFSKTYNGGSVEEVVLSIGGDNVKPSKDDCVKNLLAKLTDDCDQSNNAMNWKGGGRFTTGNTIYEITPKKERQATPSKVEGGCRSDYKFLWNEYIVWGRGWSGNDGGSRLKGEVDDCALLPDTWNFEYGLGDDQREWTAKFRTGVFQKKCVASAIKEAGGDNDCEGTG